MARILIILTSHDQFGDTGNKTGFWFEELAASYYTFLDAGAEVTLASPKGGQAPLDPASNQPDYQTDATRRFEKDETALKAVAGTLRLSEVDIADYDALFYPGGYGPLWDLTDNPASIALIRAAIEAGKPVGAVCHASAVFAHVDGSDGQPLVKGRKVTGFSNSEEEALGLTDAVPFSVEDLLSAKGGHYTSADKWQSHVEIDGRLISGQNPASTAATAKALLAALA